jgi:hypothetical protein
MGISSVYSSRFAAKTAKFRQNNSRLVIERENIHREFA